MTTSMTDRMKAARDRMIVRAGLVAGQLQLPTDAVQSYLAADIDAHAAGSRLAIPATADALELVAYRPGRFTHETMTEHALLAGVSPQHVPAFGAVAGAHRVVGRYVGASFGPDGERRLPILLDARLGDFGLYDALRILGLPDPVRDRTKTLLERLGEARGHTLGAVVGPDGAGPIRVVRMIRFEAPAVTASVARGIIDLANTLGIEGLEADFGEWFAHLRPGPTTHDVLVSLFVDEGGVHDRVDVDFLALPTAYALDALGALGIDESVAEAAAFVEGLIKAPEDPQGNRWVDVVRATFARDAEPRAELAWFLNAARFMDEGGPLN